jgi:hypothetical protein
MADLFAFLERDDVDPLAQAAIAHAQFESVHPFTDGNGRIGRALVNAVLRRRGLTTSLVVPVAAALVADRAGYFHELERYRDGHVDGIVTLTARSSWPRSDSTRSNTTALPSTGRTTLLGSPTSPTRSVCSSRTPS